MKIHEGKGYRGVSSILSEVLWKREAGCEKIFHCMLQGNNKGTDQATVTTMDAATKGY